MFHDSIGIKAKYKKKNKTKTRVILFFHEEALAPIYMNAVPNVCHTTLTGTLIGWQVVFLSRLNLVQEETYGAFRLSSFCIGRRLSTLVFCGTTRVMRTNIHKVQSCCERLASADVDRCTAMKSECTISNPNVCAACAVRHPPSMFFCPGHILGTVWPTLMIFGMWVGLGLKLRMLNFGRGRYLLST